MHANPLLGNPYASQTIVPGSVVERLREHADTHRCRDCAVPTSYAIGSYWLADDDLWNRVVGDNSIVLCPACFHDRAEAQGVAVSWRAHEDPKAKSDTRSAA